MRIFLFYLINTFSFKLKKKKNILIFIIFFLQVIIIYYKLLKNFLLLKYPLIIFSNSIKNKKTIWLTSKFLESAI